MNAVILRKAIVVLAATVMSGSTAVHAQAQDTATDTTLTR